MTQDREEQGTPLRVAVWSGPRNVSTAMMRAWENRPDTTVCDEPFYAHYLSETNLPHPGKDEIIARCETDWRKVVDMITGPVPDGKTVFYQKHMAHHLLPHMSRDWLSSLVHVFLIREPAEMLLSLAQKLDQFGLEHTGLPQQAEVFDVMFQNPGIPPIVIDSRDLLTQPAEMLAGICTRLGLPYYDTMLSWPTGERPTDGVWAKYWYHNVQQSSGFKPYRPNPKPLPDRLQELYTRCKPFYDKLYTHRLTV